MRMNTSQQIINQSLFRSTDESIFMDTFVVIKE